MPAAPKRPHRAAVTRMLRSTGLAQVPEEAPLVELLRTLADEMDSNGSARVTQAYLSALKDVRRVLGEVGVRPRGSAETKAPKTDAEAPSEQDDDAVVPNELAEFKQKRGIVA